MPDNESRRDDIALCGKPRRPVARRRFGGMVRPEELRREVYVMTEADHERALLVDRIYELIEGWRG